MQKPVLGLIFSVCAVVNGPASGENGGIVISYSSIVICQRGVGWETHLDRMTLNDGGSRFQYVSLKVADALPNRHRLAENDLPGRIDAISTAQ